MDRINRRAFLGFGTLASYLAWALTKPPPSGARPKPKPTTTTIATTTTLPAVEYSDMYTDFY